MHRKLKTSFLSCIVHLVGLQKKTGVIFLCAFKSSSSLSFPCSCDGFLLPLDPLAEPSSASTVVGSAGVSPWQCNECERVTSADDVAAVVDRVQVGHEITWRAMHHGIFPPGN
jgi:Zn-finger protein